MRHNINKDNLFHTIARFVHLTDDQFEGYMERTLLPDDQAAVEKHLAICPRCSADVQIVRDALAVFDAPVQLPSPLVFDDPHSAPGENLRPYLEVAAASAETSSRATSGFEPLGTFEIEGSSYQALQDSQGRVYIKGVIPAESKNLHLGGGCYGLKEQAAGIWELVDADPVVIQSFLMERTADTLGNFIWFQQSQS